MGSLPQLLITPSLSQTLHHHRMIADAAAPAIAMVIRPGQRRWAGRRRHGNADTHGSPTSPAGGRSDNVTQMLREAPRGTVVMPQAAKTGLGRRPRMHPKERGLQKQVVLHDLVEPAARPRLILGSDRLADFRDRRLGDRGLIAECFGKRGLDIPHRQAAHKRRYHQLIRPIARAHGEGEHQADLMEHPADDQ